MGPEPNDKYPDKRKAEDELTQAEEKKKEGAAI